MRPIYLLLLGLSLFNDPPSLRAQGNEAALRGELEQTYTQWCHAMSRKEPQAWAAAISLYRQTIIRNALVSERRHFPDAVFETDVQPPAVQGLRLLEAEAIGDTAHLVYFGKIDMGQDRELVRENILKLKFLRENGVWKYDSNRVTRLDNEPEVIQELRSGKRPDFLDTPEYTPPGKAPPIPPLCRVPDHKAGYKLQTFGYETTLNMNSVSYDPVQDGLDQGLLIGGLVNGHNEITLHIKPLPVPQGEKASLQLRVYILTNDPAVPGKEVLRWEAPATGVPAKVTLPIEVK